MHNGCRNQGGKLVRAAVARRNGLAAGGGGGGGGGGGSGSDGGGGAPMRIDELAVRYLLAPDAASAEAAWPGVREDALLAHMGGGSIAAARVAVRVRVRVSAS